MVSTIACHILLLSGQTDSAFYSIQDGRLDGIESAIEVVEQIVQSKCKVFPKITQTTCRYLIPTNLSTFVCYSEADVGYFFLAKDMLDNINVIFNRWD